MGVQVDAKRTDGINASQVDQYDHDVLRWFQRSKDGWHSLGSVPRGVGGRKKEQSGCFIGCHETRRTKNGANTKEKKRRRWGVEPTMADLQSAALATWLRRHWMQADLKRGLRLLT